MPEDLPVVVEKDQQAVIVSDGRALLAKIRPHWQARSLIQRVERLLPIDPSSACQRLFNAAIHDLRDKIVSAGLDIATEAAAQNKLPPVTKPDDIFDSYSPSNIIDLAFRMGLLTRPEWRRVRRAYEIRRDLEHEDDEYEAEIADCVYMFTASIDLVLSRDPVQLLRISDVKDVVEASEPALPTMDFVRDYGAAPEVRQREIARYLIGTALDKEAPDAVRYNALEILEALSAGTKNAVKIDLANELEKRADRKMKLSQMRVAAAGGFMGYVKTPLVLDFFDRYERKVSGVGYRWQHHEQHSDLLDNLEDCGGLQVIPEGPRRKIVLWMTLCYIGEPGGYGTFGRNRRVFYSNAAAPLIERLIRAAGKTVQADVAAAGKTQRVKAAMENKYLARRYEALLDLVESA